jgi:hypothetical protein
MKRIVLLATVTILLVLGLVAVAQAASPQDIYNDYAADGKLTGPYTKAELQAYLDDAAIDEYGNPTVTEPLDALVGRVLGIFQAQQGVTFADALKQAVGQSTTDQSRGTFPFTGFQGIAVLLGCIVLVGSGLALRRAAR